MSSEDNSPNSNLENLDLNLLKVFMTLMQERSVTKASESLRRTQSAVSHSLAKLREFFEDELFSRVHDSMEPTTRARELADVISLSLKSINDVVDKHRTFDPRTTTRKFRVGVNDYTAMAYISELTKEFLRSAPNATINVINVYESQAEQMLRNGKIDYAIVSAYNLMESNLELISLSSDRLMCVGWSGNPLFQKPISTDDYLQSPHIRVTGDGASEGIVDRTLKTMNLQRKVVATVPHYWVVPSILKGTNLLALLRDSFLPMLPEDGELRVVPPPFNLRAVNICLVLDPSLYKDEGHLWLRDLIVGTWHRQNYQRREFISRLNIPEGG